MLHDVEKVDLKDVPHVISKTDKKTIVIWFYIINLNLYLVSLLSFERFGFKVLMYFIVNSFIFKTMFSRFPRFGRMLFWHIVIFIIYIVEFDGWIWQYYLLIGSTVINYMYHVLVVNNGQIGNKDVS